MIFVYNVFFILILGLVFRKKIDDNKYKKIYLGIIFFQMTLLQGLRAIEVGTDTTMYVNTYERYLSSEFYAFQFTHFEPGFQMLYNILHKIGFDSQGLLIFVSAITMLCFAIFIYRNSDNIVLSSFIFACIIYPNSFNIMRQSLGLGIAINSLYYMLNKKYIRSVMIILVATCFHYTSILMFIPLVICVVKNWKLVRNILLFSSVIFYVFGNRIVSSILPYFGKSFYTSGYGVQRIFRMTTMITFIIAFISWYFLKNGEINEYKRKINLFSCIAFVNMIFGILYLKFEFFSRIIEYFNSFLIIAIPAWIVVGRRKYTKLYKIAFSVGAFLLMLNAVYNSASGIEEYKFFFG